MMKRQRIRKTLLLIALFLFQARILHLFMSPVVPVLAARAGVVPGSLVVYGDLFLSSLVLCGNCVDACASNSARFVWTENPKPLHQGEMTRW